MKRIKHLSVPLSENCINGLLNQCMEKKTTELGVKGIYMTNIALVAHMRWGFDDFAGAGKENSGASNTDSQDDIKRVIGRFLRSLSGYAEQAGFGLPVIGIVDADKDKMNTVEQWASEQDWHRGDFSLFTANKDELEEMSQRFLSSASEAWEHIEPIEPLTSKQYLAKLEEERRVSKITAEHESLLIAIEAAWRDKTSMDEAIKQWLEHQLYDAESLIAGS